jgi:hypothetical protein
MRNLVSALLFIAMINLAFAARTMSEKQKALFDLSLVSKLKSSNLGRAVLLLAEVHAK